MSRQGRIRGVSQVDIPVSLANRVIVYQIGFASGRDSALPNP